MDGYSGEDRELMKCATDLEFAKKRLDYLVGKRWFIGCCFAVFAIVALGFHIGWRYIASEPGDIEGTRTGMILFGSFAALCLGFGGSIDAQVKALILHVHSQGDGNDTGTVDTSG